MNKFWKLKSLYKYILGATGTKVSFPNQPGIIPIEKGMIFVKHRMYTAILWSDQYMIWYGTIC